MRVIAPLPAGYTGLPLAGASAAPQFFSPYWATVPEFRIGGPARRLASVGIPLDNSTALGRMLQLTKSRNQQWGHATLVLLDPAKFFGVHKDKWTNVSRHPLTNPIQVTKNLVERENEPFICLQVKSKNAQAAFFNLVSCLLAVNLVPNLEQTRNVGFVDAAKAELNAIRFSPTRQSSGAVMDFDPRVEIVSGRNGTAFSLLFPLSSYFFTRGGIYPHHLLAQGAAVLFDNAFQYHVSMNSKTEGVCGEADYLNFDGTHGNVLSALAFVAASDAERKKLSTLVEDMDEVDEAVFAQVYPDGAKFLMNHNAALHVDSAFVKGARGEWLGTVHRGLFPLLAVERAAGNEFKLDFALGAATISRNGRYSLQARQRAQR
ncbi:MAG: hypothetical protein COX62_08695 [Deltaproteobacteria bacterium CG_4_10_14_0_2_um_filter_43_8]|nr:MAG: hypothetical protein COV43_05980 [Deltaproteobacteria bacterium CG11_big_fil_rev_8_21_14_0_20_42_23]PJA18419.1 MAG: hypothetical protein COX62_08695 [Deltaproteobacteria bacterium CG_4_10_14_0_2_um_filter_43_8]PJC65198.1 MAG: hypothetical protein CO021_00430 [Deltaproteobacteria bacterium CG_4_9_14_0_2_um_filter_42_21]